MLPASCANRNLCGFQHCFRLGSSTCGSHALKREKQLQSIFTISVMLISWFPTHFTKNVKWMGHGASLHHQ
jgi:hypothetical protein